MRRISLRSTNSAGGATTKLKNDISGSCTTITITSPTSEKKSRPTEVIIRLITWVAAAAPADSRMMNSVECRSEKKPRPSLSSLVNTARWLSAMMRLPMRDIITLWP